PISGPVGDRAYAAVSEGRRLPEPVGAPRGPVVVGDTELEDQILESRCPALADGRQVGRAVQSLGPPVVYLQDSEVRVPPQGGEACEPAFGEQACEILPEAEVGSTEADAKERSGAFILRVPAVLCSLPDEDCESGELGLAEQPISAGGVH